MKNQSKDKKVLDKEDIQYWAGEHNGKLDGISETIQKIKEWVQKNAMVGIVSGVDLLTFLDRLEGEK